jgi:hypothetical protein
VLHFGNNCTSVLAKMAFVGAEERFSRGNYITATEAVIHWLTADGPNLRVEFKSQFRQERVGKDALVQSDGFFEVYIDER